VAEPGAAGAGFRRDAALNGPAGVAHAVTGISWRGLVSVLYLGAVANDARLAFEGRQ